MENVQIKEVALADVALLKQISRDTFYQAFHERNSAENMNSFLDEAYSETKLSAEINTTGSAFYFAELDGDIMGYLKVNTGAAQVELKDQHSLEVERIYVLQKYHGQKIGQLLMDHAMKLAAEMNADFIWLGVWEHNERAIAFYRKNSFVPFDTHKFLVGEDVQTDIMMKKILK
jgi:diamine N-acetyltransferase